jgi:hypothetical protein
MLAPCSSAYFTQIKSALQYVLYFVVAHFSLRALDQQPALVSVSCVTKTLGFFVCHSQQEGMYFPQPFVLTLTGFTIILGPINLVAFTSLIHMCIMFSRLF